MINKEICFELNNFIQLFSEALSFGAIIEDMLSQMTGFDSSSLPLRPGLDYGLSSFYLDSENFQDFSFCNPSIPIKIQILIDISSFMTSNRKNNASMSSELFLPFCSLYAFWLISSNGVSYSWDLSRLVQFRGIAFAFRVSAYLSLSFQIIRWSTTFRLRCWSQMIFLMGCLW